MSASDTSLWAPVLAAVVGFTLVTLSGLIAYIFHQLRGEVRVANRHLNSLMTTAWQILWRLDAIETELEKTGYRAPKISDPGRHRG